MSGILSEGNYASSPAWATPRKEETEEHYMGSDKNFSHRGDPTDLLPFISLYGSPSIIWMNGRMDDQMDNWRPQFNETKKT